MAPNSVETPATTPQPPPVPERFDFEAVWTVAAPDGVEVEVHVWVDWSRGDAEVRILHGLKIGDAANIRDSGSFIPSGRAVDRYGIEWVERQLHHSMELLAKRPRRWAPS
jgi:hypothetical protein